MFELRTYTLASVEALERYETVHWARHIPSLAAAGVTTHAIWRQEPADAPTLIALVSYADGADPGAVTAEYMSSQAFRDDMAGFTMSDIVAVHSVFLAPAEASPLR
ncbi:NIPSNAP family protein [Klenkia taihuensis]|uniref:NIPSNAP protein n=1 Tax=Klenkia taihuensis TaxID=1225127 RepID=A0A1I1U574_9ACTN|nr:NIPSNAP family protein [Klenkia taihuensis]GHE06932.1 hypothetical protein GCM10011381_00790 [Klenkia taihuensis]SFD65845.1 NIPSNAP protein [Klenkia taihuensis]